MGHGGTGYLSSTFTDLREQREAIYKLLRRIGHEVIAVEDYVASDERPVRGVLPTSGLRTFIWV